MGKSVELCREEGVEFRSIRLRLDASGIRLDAHDMGPPVERAWGSDDYEFWVNVKAEDLAALACVLLEEKYRGRSDSGDNLRRFCERNAVPHEFDSWK